MRGELGLRQLVILILVMLLGFILATIINNMIGGL